jgi:MYXO-CTERM domain-containing protein
MKLIHVPSRWRSKVFANAGANALGKGDRPSLRPRGLRSLTIALGAFALSSAAARESRAEQFVLFDAMINFTWEDANNSKPSKSHFYVNEANFLNKDRPKNWLTPVDYRNGTVHVRTEVISKPPGTQATGWTLCYIPAAGGGYGCADSVYYKSTGIHENDVKMTSFWNNAQVGWAGGIKQMDLIYAINDSGSGHVHNYPALKDQTTPTKVRLTMIQVSAGSTYDPTKLNFADGGMPAAPSDAGASGGASGSSDAGPDSASGTGGRGGGSGAGSGGSSGATGAGGVVASGGSSGGPSGTGGTPSSPPPPPTTSTGGSASTSGSGGNSGSSPPCCKPSVSGGCAFASSSGPSSGLATFGLALALAALTVARRRRR